MKAPELQKPPSDTNPEKSRNSRYIIKAFLLVVLLTGSLAIMRFTVLSDYLDTSNVNLIRDKLAEFRSLAPVIFLLSGALVIVMGAPRSIISILGGMIFGFSMGMFLSLTAALGGSFIIFLLTRFLGRPLFNQTLGLKLKAVKNHIETNGLMAVILLRQLPLPCMFVNALIGLTRITSGTFLLGSLLGHMPQALIFSLYGSSVREAFILRVSLASFLLVLFVVTLGICYKRSSLAKNLAQKLTNYKTS